MKNNEIVTMKSFEKKYGIGFCTEHTGKMAGMGSLSTSAVVNPNCQKYCKVDGAICQECFARAMFERYKNMNPKYERNFEVLTTQIIPVEEFPVLNFAYFRLEAFGDIANDTQVVNYFNLCKRNPHTRFALWTKNPHIIQAVLGAGYKKPRNLNIIVSSLFVNEERNVDAYDWCDKVFTVYDKGYIAENDVKINCGARSCMNCLKCYKKGGAKVINEILK